MPKQRNPYRFKATTKHDAWSICDECQTRFFYVDAKRTENKEYTFECPTCQKETSPTLSRTRNPLL
jgi:hypothetical protein